MGLTLARCPACGAELNLETDRDYFYCPHCGSKVLQVDDRIVIEHVNRTVDEAEVKRVELEREKHASDEKRLERIEQKSDRRSAMILIIGCILIVVGLILDRMSPRYDSTGTILFSLGGLIAVFGMIAYLPAFRNNTNKSDDKKNE